MHIYIYSCTQCSSDLSFEEVSLKCADGYVNTDEGCVEKLTCNSGYYLYV